jgi:hypothetical protein
VSDTAEVADLSAGDVAASMLNADSKRALREFVTKLFQQLRNHVATVRHLSTILLRWSFALAHEHCQAT